MEPEVFGEVDRVSEQLHAGGVHHDLDPRGALGIDLNGLYAGSETGG